MRHGLLLFANLISSHAIADDAIMLSYFVDVGSIKLGDCLFPAGSFG
jgi:hypothetical protein